ncbi:Short C-terminal domain-containing protein [Cetobacterium ceti]|uniref:Short C-terminal domain-containing protein n=1 Tax=Cetobacterium ceti TaxID=180163 RepID=A0A1T4R273_9FUSO|nr:PH domain-containing protein [Cetobacterium ceti]SKA09986.1 Short C-terminal domain-containing protein [Cetobacterium ceti]
MTYDEILKRIKELGQVDTFGTKKEIKELPNILFPDETIEYLMSGFLNGNTWLITCTNKRVLFLDKGLLFGCKQLETPLEKINSIQSNKGLILGSITIWDGAGPMKIDKVQKYSLQPFVTAVNNAKEALKKSSTTHVVHHEEKKEDFIAQLEKLAELRERGIVTQEEFEAKKKQILNL